MGALCFVANSAPPLVPPRQENKGPLYAKQEGNSNINDVPVLVECSTGILMHQQYCDHRPACCLASVVALVAPMALVDNHRWVLV